MIQEPQQPEIIEIPTVESMTTVQSNLNKKSLILNKINNIQNNLNNIQSNQNNNSNNKSRTTVIQIPKQNSKPRIFLLTRPAKTQLVRLATPSVQHHYQKNLNPPQLEKTTGTNIDSQIQSKIIRIPFLPRSQVQTFSVKSNQANQVLKKDTIVVPQEVTQYKNINRNTVQASQVSIQAQQGTTQYPLKNQVITKRLSPIKEISNQLHTPQSVKRTITQSTVNSLNLSENKRIKAPLTLTSMAGIELTGADMSLSQADMSGAMPPTATVEEINVPVFIDEYLQQASTSTTTNNNIFNINNNNSNNHHQSNGKGYEVNKCLDTFENFEFDIDLLTDNTSEDYNKEEDKEEIELLEQQQHLQNYQQQQLTEVDDDKKTIKKNNLQQNSIDDIEEVKQQQNKQQLQLQLMLEEILFNNNNNNNNNNTNNNINKNSANTTSNNNNNNNMNNMANTPEVFDELLSQESLFKVAPFNQMSEEILSPDDKELMEDLGYFNSTELSNMEEAIDFTHIDNELELNDCFITSQPNEVMFSSSILSQLASSQNFNQKPTVAKLSQEISEAEPTIAPEMMHYSNSNLSIAATTSSALISTCDSIMDDGVACSTSYFFDELTVDDKESKTLINPLKRNGSQTSKHMEEKRKKLHLDMKLCREIDLTQQNDINTPNLINMLLQTDDQSIDIMGQTENSMDTIYRDLISTSPQCASVKSEIVVDELTNDFSPPNTPYSVNSTSNQTNFTGFMNTAPNSPASSIATTTNTSVTNKRGRGRPAKLHSDVPDLSQIQHLPETEQKKLLERAKNNEASRKSRMKHKERDNALEKEEEELRLRNRELNSELLRIRRIEKKLQEALRVQHFQLKSHQAPK